MNKHDKKLNNLITPLISEILNANEMNQIKISLIKEEIKNNSYQINPTNIANKIIKLSADIVEELVCE